MENKNSSKIHNVSLGISMVLLLMLFAMLAGVSSLYEDRLLKHYRTDLQQIVTEQGIDLSSRLSEEFSLVNSLWSFCETEKDNPAFLRHFKVFAEGLGWDRSGLRVLQVFPPIVWRTP